MGTHLGAELLVRLEGILGDAHVAGKMREEVVPAELQCGDLGEGLGGRTDGLPREATNAQGG